MQTILGTMTFSDQVDRDNSAAMIRAFKDSGHAQVDTAFTYNGGKTEQLLGELIADGVLASLPLASKVNPKEGGLGRDAINAQFSTTLERLGVDGIDLLYLHMPDLDTPIRETLGAVDDIYRAGRIKRFGLSNYAAWQVAEIMGLCTANDWVKPAVYQGMYNAFTRDVERELLPCLANYGIAFYAYNPLAGGMLTGKHERFDATPQAGRFESFSFYQDRYWKPEYFAVVQAFADACRAADIKPAAAALRWLNHHSAIANGNDHGVILGASSTTQLAENLAACAADPLPADIVSSLDAGWDVVRPACMKYFRP